MPTNAGPGTNQFRCSGCGRYFNTAEELRAHEFECTAAKEATPHGHAELEEQRSTSHAPNDQDSKQHPFQHGRR